MARHEEPAGGLGRDSHVMLAIWMRFPQVSSKTAVVDRPHLGGLLGEADPEAAQPLVLGLHVVDGERRERDAVARPAPP